jgi:CRISPR-associated protein Cst2
MSTNPNLFATVLTYAAPSANYRGENEENRAVLQKITKGGHEYPVISPESIRNALREILAQKGLPMNRHRLDNEDQLAVEFKEFPDASKYADDFLFGFMVADQKAVKANKGHPAKRDSVLRMNLAMALTPYRFNATLHQSPLNAGESPWKNSSSSALLHREVAHTAFQYPFALALADCHASPDGAKWSGKLLEAIGELVNVAGNHARSLYEMAPRSLVVRVTQRLAGGFDSYGFNEKGEFPELVRIKAGDLPGKEFFVGGELARSVLPKDEKERLGKEGVTFHDNPAALLAEVARRGELV